MVLYSALSVITDVKRPEIEALGQNPVSRSSVKNDIGWDCIRGRSTMQRYLCSNISTHPWNYSFPRTEAAHLQEALEWLMN